MALQNLQGDGTILIVSEEWSTTRFSDILHHTTYTHRAVQLVAQINDEIRILQVLDVCFAAAEVLLYEADYLLNLFMGILTSIQQAQILESFLL